MDLNHYYGVIMAGGGGTRLWPFSRRQRPKQMVRLGGERTLFQQAVDRLTGLIPTERIFVVTVADQAAALHAQYKQIPWQNFLIEPAPRGTASVVGLAALAIRRIDPQATMAVVTADHLIKRVDYFRELLTSAYHLAQEQYLVTLGIEPTYPSTGYGYIHRGGPLGEYARHPAFRVERFHEKPDLETANRFLSQGNYDWNSGMFVWRADRIWNEIAGLMPDLYHHLVQIDRAWGGPEQAQVLTEHWRQIKPETVDYGIMERASQVAVIPAENLGWNDVGAWDSLYDVFESDADSNGNIVVDARHIGIDTHGTLVMAEKPDRLVVTIGAQDLIVVETPDALLICDRNQAQKVRELVDMLKSAEKTDVENLAKLGIEPGNYL
ncbi:MAG TPA: sugar phosphate nucleotidyltransferase [Anaerolinea sp.]|nr:sugar phosphate nucleotidyltransferase [Anaerolinea sp.]